MPSQVAGEERHDGPEVMPRCKKDSGDSILRDSKERSPDDTTMRRRQGSTALPLSARTSPPDFGSSRPLTAARAMKTSRLQHALVEAHEYLQRTSSAARCEDTAGLSKATHESKTLQPDKRWVTRTPSTGVSSFSPPRFNAEELMLARSAVHLVTDKIPSVPRVDHLAQARLLQAIASELPFTIENPTKRHETDVRCWYTLGKVVGKGTFGRVSIAHHRVSGTLVAIKSYYREHGATVCCPAPRMSAKGSSLTKRVTKSSSDALDWKSVRREVKMMAALRPHTSTIRFIEAFETPTQMHIVTEFVAGETLCDFLQLHGKAIASGGKVQRLSEVRARSIFAQLCSAVASLHDQNVIHRDLKLENVLVDKHGSIKLIDFGFSQFDHSDDRCSGSGSSEKTFCGTPSYMAPEVVASKSYDGKRVDVWSLGVVLYVLLCGRFPFQGHTFHQLYHNIRTTQCVFPISGSGGEHSVLRDAQALIRSIFVLDPSKRPCVRDILAHPWVTTRSEILQPRIASTHFFAALLSWDEATARICEMLEQIYGLDASELQLAIQDKRRNGATALVRLLRLEVEKESAVLLESSEPRHSRAQIRSSARGCEIVAQEDQQVSSLNADAGFIASSVNVECGVPSASAHRKHLDDLIGRVKASLSLQH